jgi:hypothetical protein
MYIWKYRSKLFEDFTFGMHLQRVASLYIRKTPREKTPRGKTPRSVILTPA